MHAVCGYPVKTTWLNAVKSGKYTGWPLITVQNVQKCYPVTTDTPKGHMNQTCKNICSTKTKPHQQSTHLHSTTLEEYNNTYFRGKKERDVYTKLYEVRDTLFSYQTGKFPTRSRQGNKCVMVMVEIENSGILVEPMKSRKYAEILRAYAAIMKRLHVVNIVPRKHVMDNEVSETLKPSSENSTKWNLSWYSRVPTDAMM